MAACRDKAFARLSCRRRARLRVIIQVGISPPGQLRSGAGGDTVHQLGSSGYISPSQFPTTAGVSGVGGSQLFSARGTYEFRLLRMAELHAQRRELRPG